MKKTETAKMIAACVQELQAIRLPLSEMNAVIKIGGVIQVLNEQIGELLKEKEETAREADHQPE